MRRFELLQPTTADEAITLLARHGARASLLAGGTDLLVEIKEGLRAPDFVIDAKRISGMKQLSFSPVDGLSIGALATAREVETNEHVKASYRGLWKRCASLARSKCATGRRSWAISAAPHLPPILCRR